jgi:hypothetical protein
VTAAVAVLSVLVATIVIVAVSALLHRWRMRRGLAELLRARDEREGRGRIERDRARLQQDVDGLRAELATLKGEMVRRETVARAHGAVIAHVPRGEVVAVVSRGDEELVNLDERTGWHFPQDVDGVYAGHHPETSDDAVAHLEALRERGARFLLLPATAAWWLDHYDGLRDHLETRHVRVTAEDAGCALYALADGGGHARRLTRATSA